MSHWKIYHSYGDVTIDGEELQILNFLLGILSLRDLYRATPTEARDQL